MSAVETRILYKFFECLTLLHLLHAKLQTSWESTTSSRTSSIVPMSPSSGKLMYRDAYVGDREMERRTEERAEDNWLSKPWKHSSVKRTLPLLSAT
jgi:hypothetical protein